MGTILAFAKPEKGPILRVCGNCRFFKKDGTVPHWSACYAMGGHEAHEVWPECQGKYWQPKRTLWQWIRAAITPANCGTGGE